MEKRLTTCWVERKETEREKQRTDEQKSDSDSDSENKGRREIDREGEVRSVIDR
jgi:hypothetical protein